MYTNDERILGHVKTVNCEIAQEYVKRSNIMDTDPFIFDDLSFNSKKRSLEDREELQFQENFDKWIDCDC